MCTAVSANMGTHFFGRNLDLEYSLNESVIVTPRNYSFNFRFVKDIPSHYALIGMGITEDGFPLYYEATNEKGLSAAALSFPEAKYNNESVGIDNICSFELIPWILCQCKTVEECKKLLIHTVIIDTPFSRKYPASPIHWLISDSKQSITVECTDTEVNVYDNEADMLTNSPAFPLQIFNLNNYMYLSQDGPENRLTKSINLRQYSRGMGAMGMPGDLSSMSRFVRGFFIKEKLFQESDYGKQLAQFFRLLDSVSQQKGAVRLPDGKYEYTVYSCCCDTVKGVYYYSTYFDCTVKAVDMHKERLDGKCLVSYPIKDSMAVKLLN